VIDFFFNYPSIFDLLKIDLYSFFILGSSDQMARDKVDIDFFYFFFHFKI